MRFLEAKADWIATSAKVIACTYKYASITDMSLEDGIDHSKYQILFCYQAVGEHYEGYFFQYDPIEEGAILPLLYNPSEPMENNLSLFPEKPSSRLLLWSAGLAFAALIIYLCEHFGLVTD